MIKKYLVSRNGLIVVIVCVVLVVLFRNNFTSRNQTSEHIVSKATISEEIVAAGEVSTSGYLAVYSSSTGIIESLSVQNGDQVVKGQELFTIQSSANDIERSQAYASYQTALTQLNAVKQQKIANQALLEDARGSVIDASLDVTQMKDRRNTGRTNPATGLAYTQDEIDSIESAYTSALNAFSSAEKKYINSDSAIETAQSALTAALYAYQATSNGKIKAPIDGVIKNLSVEVGSAIMAKTSGQPLAYIAPNNYAGTIVVIQLSELDVAKLTQGVEAEVVFDAFPDKQFTGIVERIDEVGSKSNSVVSYTAYIRIQTTDQPVYGGMTATVSIQTNTRENVLVVPNRTINKRDETYYVTVINGRNNAEQTITLGVKNGEFTEITSGLTEGQRIKLQ